MLYLSSETQQSFPSLLVWSLHFAPSKFLSGSTVYLYWQLPEETRELIPTRYLCPPKGMWQ